MLHMFHSMQEDTTPTDAMNLGSALHCAFLEPELMPERVVVYEKRRVGKEWDEFKAEHAGKIILTTTYYEHLKGMVRSARKHPEIRKWSAKEGDVEVSRVTKIMGVRVKGRVDKITDDPLLDLKSSSADLDEDKFVSNIVKFGYHIQGAIYRKIFDRERFILGVIESTPPYDAVPFELDKELLDFGWREAKMLISSWKYCCEKEHWPGRSEEIVTIGLPKWLKDEAGYEQLTSGGVPVKL